MERRTRRGFLIGMLAMPVVAAGAGAMSVARRGIATMRPAARGTTSGVCGLCGADGHTMLDPACPAAPKVV